MRLWKTRTTKYFYSIVIAVVLVVTLIILSDALQYRQVRSSLTTYMDNLRDMIFMSTYDSLKKGNMKVFKSHLEEIGTFVDVREFSLLNKQGEVRYSSDPSLVRQFDAGVVGVNHQQEQIQDGFSTYYFPVETISYCSRCHPGWETGSINSYYKLTLSRKALDTVRLTTLYSHAFTATGGGVFLAFVYLLFTLFERKQHEEQMQLSASVFENAVEAMVITTADGRIDKINPAFTQITGFAADEIIGQDIHLLDAGEINREAYREMRQQLGSDGLWTGELWNRRKDGESFPVRLSVTAVRNSQDRVTHFVSIFYDITARKAAERALVEMGQMKSEFISTAAHELRTPLSAMMAFTDFARDPAKFGGFPEEKIREFMNLAYDKGQALNQLIDDLLDVSRIERGQPIELKKEPLDLLDVIGKVFDFYTGHAPDYHFHLDLPDASDAAICLVDRHRINQVLENLLNNAIKYSARGSTIVVSGRLQQNNWVISIEDHGHGMTPEQVDRIFEKFYRADSSDTSVSGLGLGMSIAKKIVELHGGSIWVESVKGEGTTVRFTVPRQPG